MVSNGRDERGQCAAFDVVHDVRHTLFTALLGWEPEPGGNPVTYDGGTLLDLNRHELMHQFDFVVDTEINAEDTRQYVDLNHLPAFHTVAIDLNEQSGNVKSHLEMNIK